MEPSEIKSGFSFFLKEGWENFYWGASGTTEQASAGVKDDVHSVLRISSAHNKGDPQI
jgi:hypothetical protein